MKTTVDRDLPSRIEARQVACPECNAAPSEHCIGAKGQIRTANHRSRIKAWMVRDDPTLDSAA